MRAISRAAAAIEIIDDYLIGKPIEVALKSWFRGNRFAGSGDRYSIRDIIFEVLRKRKSLIFPFELRGYKENGRLLILSYLADHYKKDELINEIKENEYFLNPPNSNEIKILDEKNQILAEAPSSIAFNYPSFLADGLSQSLGADLKSVMKEMQERAPLYLRVNLIKNQTTEAQKKLAAEGILCSRLSIATNALQVIEGGKLVKSSRSYNSGMIEIQDLSSQVMCDLPEIIEGKCILDYCAGGGGKILAIASTTMNRGELLAFDINQKRLVELISRANRAGATIKLLNILDLNNYRSSCDVVFVDAPCSGSGVWRRDPQAKWNLTKNRLEELKENQAKILKEASSHVKVGGVIIYVVCSLLPEEGDAQVNFFLMQNHNFRDLNRMFLHPLVAGDGFFRAVLKRVD
ncbi:MAG: RsmB/NOP family class I SAM-dependent RNA methyltransferase [Paracoccaceae bacterium]|nr:RsmB/NOP family class I SAM-dependent RNA methyltransferase [Paracoccaceae bacterium]